jgi:hypothetical protein
VLGNFGTVEETPTGGVTQEAPSGPGPLPSAVRTPVPQQGSGSTAVRTPAPQQGGPPGAGLNGRSPAWGDDETLFLIAERGAREYRRETGSSLGQLRETKKQRDEGLAKCLNAKGFGPRTGNQVNNRWDVIRTGYTKINDWNKRLGQLSYWDLGPTERKKWSKAKKLPVYYR